VNIPAQIGKQLRRRGTVRGSLRRSALSRLWLSTGRWRFVGFHLTARLWAPARRREALAAEKFEASGRGAESRYQARHGIDAD